ncbi:MAG: DUF4389 domain-containing protein [Burkholderiales bacterium]
MTDSSVIKRNNQSIWMRGVFMLVMALAFQLAVSLLALVAIAQFIVTAASDEPNERLKSLGHMLGQYLRQIADYETFASDDAPFPFSDWPTSR